MPMLLPVLLIVGFVVFSGIMLILAAKQAARARRNLDGLAAALGLQVIEPPPAMGLRAPASKAAGEVRGKQVELFNYTTGSGKSRQTWCAISAAPRADGGLTFALSRQGLGTTFMELFGAREIQVGEADFDRRWFIQTNEPDFFRAALLPELRTRITAAALPSRAGFRLESGRVRYVEPGSFANDERCRRFEALAGVVCDLADVAEVWAEQKGGARP